MSKQAYNFESEPILVRTVVGDIKNYYDRQAIVDHMENYHNALQRFEDSIITLKAEKAELLEALKELTSDVDWHLSDMEKEVGVLDDSNGKAKALIGKMETKHENT
jgi:uncharacterized coiled-coil DUF342 family protein